MDCDEEIKVNGILLKSDVPATLPLHQIRIYCRKAINALLTV